MSIAPEPSTITHGIQLAVAPVFLLTAVVGMIGAVAGRLARIIDRARVVEDRAAIPAMPNTTTTPCWSWATCAPVGAFGQCLHRVADAVRLLIGVTIVLLFLGETMDFGAQLGGGQLSVGRDLLPGRIGAVFHRDGDGHPPAQFPATEREREVSHGLVARPQSLGGLVYSTDHGRMCPACSKPQAQCVCKQIKPVPTGDGIVRVSRETKGRGGKAVTLVKGVLVDSDQLEQLGKQLKTALVPVAPSGTGDRGARRPCRKGHGPRCRSWVQGQAGRGLKA